MPESEKDNWYEWCIANWGTKWDVSTNKESVVVDDNGVLTVSFDTAWGPPIVAYDRLQDAGFTVRAYYYEEGMDFAGFYDDRYTQHLDGISTMSPDEIRDDYPELDEAFGIADRLEEQAEEDEWNDEDDDEDE